MRHLWLFMFVTVILGCSEIEPGSCYPNTSGGAGGGTMPIGAGVGATTTTGTYGADPPKEAQDSTNPPPGCFPGNAYIDCRKRGLSAVACSEACTAAGAVCGAIAGHPYKSGVGTGELTWCKNGEPTYTCTYTFPNGDGCAITYNPVKPYWICMYAGGG